MRLGQELRKTVLASGVHHAAIAAARSRPDVVTIEDDDVAAGLGQLPSGRQPRVPAPHDGDVDGGRHGCRGGLRQVDVVPPVGLRPVTRRQRGLSNHAPRFAPAHALDNIGDGT